MPPLWCGNLYLKSLSRVANETHNTKEKHKTHHINVLENCTNDWTFLVSIFIHVTVSLGQPRVDPTWWRIWSTIIAKIICLKHVTYLDISPVMFSITQCNSTVNVCMKSLPRFYCWTFDIWAKLFDHISHNACALECQQWLSSINIMLQWL